MDIILIILVVGLFGILAITGWQLISALFRDIKNGHFKFPTRKREFVIRTSLSEIEVRETIEEAKSGNFDNRFLDEVELESKKPFTVFEVHYYDTFKIFREEDWINKILAITIETNLDKSSALTLVNVRVEIKRHGFDYTIFVFLNLYYVILQVYPDYTYYCVLSCIFWVVTRTMLDYACLGIKTNEVRWIVKFLLRHKLLSLKKI